MSSQTLFTETCTQNHAPKKVAISFTGGKDSTLTLHHVLDHPELYIPQLLITFIPSNFTSFRAHSLDIIRAQSEAIRLPHKTIVIEGPVFLESYRSAIRQLKEQDGVLMIATGDILPVCEDFMARAVEGTGVELLRPLWHLPRDRILNTLFDHNFRVVVTCVNVEKVPQSLTSIVGQELTPDIVALIENAGGVDLAGEWGEYHTMCLDGPVFKEAIVILGEGKAVKEGNYIWWEVGEVKVVVRGP